MKSNKIFEIADSHPEYIWFIPIDASMENLSKLTFSQHFHCVVQLRRS